MKDNIRLSIRNYLRELMLEDDVDFGKLQQHASDARGMNQGKLYKRDIQSYLKAIYSQLEIRPKTFLGAGHFGFAFLSQDGRTIKITTDKSEVVEARKWMDKNPEHLPKVFNVYKIKVGDGNFEVYVIVKEHILQNAGFINLIKKLEEDLDNWLGKYYVDVLELHNREDDDIKKFFIDNPEATRHFSKQIRTLFNDLEDGNLTSTKLAAFENYLKLKNADRQTRWYYQQLYLLYREMNSLGVSSSDTWAQNMGIRNKTLVYLDPGDGDDFGDGWIEKQPYAATVAQENLNEDDDTEYATMHNNVKNSVDDKNLQTQPIIKFLDMLHEKFGYKFKKFLGSGTYGFAFLTTDNKTVKLTTDATEMMEARKYQDKNNKHLPNIHKIQKIKVKLSGLRRWSPSDNKVDPNYKEVYLIEKDFVLQNAGLKEKFDNYIWEISDVMSTLSKQNTFFRYDSGSVINYVLLLRDIRDGKIPNKEISKLFQLVKLKDKWAYWFLIQSVELAKELRSNRMKVHDIHPANLGIMGRNLVLLDVGYASEVSKVGIKWLSKMPNHAELNQEQKLV